MSRPPVPRGVPLHPVETWAKWCPSAFFVPGAANSRRVCVCADRRDRLPAFRLVGRQFWCGSRSAACARTCNLHGLELLAARSPLRRVTTADAWIGGSCNRRDLVSLLAQFFASVIPADGLLLFHAARYDQEDHCLRLRRAVSRVLARRGRKVFW